MYESLKNLTSKNELNNLFKDKIFWESHLVQTNFVKKQTQKNLKFLNWKRRKSKSCDLAPDLHSLMTLSNVKPPSKDLTIRNVDYDKNRATEAFLNNIDSIHSKIQELSRENQTIDPYENNMFVTSRIKKEENLMNLFAPTSCYRTDLMMKMEEISRKQGKAKPRVKTLSNYIKNREDKEDEFKLKEDLEDKIKNVILYRTLKCDKMLPNEEKIKSFSSFFNKIQEKFKEKVKTNSSLLKRKDKHEFTSTNVSANKRKNQIEDDFLFNFVGTPHKNCINNNRDIKTYF